MAIVNRKTSRAQLAVLLAAALVGSGKPVQTVYAYQVGDFDAKGPVVAITSGGASRAQRAIATRQDSAFRLNVHVFVPYSATGWTEANSEDALDDIEAIIAGVLVTNRVLPGYWDFIEYDGNSEVDAIFEGGILYRHETIAVNVRKADN